MNILFTGASSFAGNTFYADLKNAGETMVSVSRRWISQDSHAADLTAEGIEHLLPDRRFDVLIHFASFVPPCEQSATWDECAPLNVYGALRLLRWAKGRVSQILLASSCAVYGPAQSVLPVREDAPLHPDTAYALTKYSQEQLFTAFCTIESIPLIVMRLGYVYGPGIPSRTAVIQLLKKIQTGERIKAVTGGSPALPLIHTDDVSRIGRHLLKRTRGIYNVASACPISVIDYVETAMSVLGKKCLFEVPNEPERQTRWFSIEKLRSEAGVEPRVDLAQGIRTLLADQVV